jgi:hypothetical protein
MSDTIDLGSNSESKSISHLELRHKPEDQERSKAIAAAKLVYAQKEQAIRDQQNREKEDPSKKS